MRLIKVSTVRALEGAKLDLTFDDGTSGVADLSGLLGLAALLDPELWRAAHVEDGVVTWNDELDIAPEAVYALAHGMAVPRTVEDVERVQAAVTMRALAGKSQVEVAASMGVAQVSRCRPAPPSTRSSRRSAVDADLARRLVALPGWRWLPGMRPIHVDGLPYLHGTHIPTSADAEFICGSPYWLPDLNDPATAGCLLAMLTHVSRYADLFHITDADGAAWWEVYYGDEVSPQQFAAGPNLGHACALALVALGRCV